MDIITYIVICNNTKDNFLWEPQKMNFKFHGNGENTGKIIKHKTSFCEIWSFWSFFSRAPIRTLSLELFHVTYTLYYIYSPQKV